MATTKSTSAPSVSIFIPEDDMVKYIKESDKKFGKWEGGKKVSSGEWDKYKLNRSKLYREAVINGYIVKSLRELIESVQRDGGQYEGFMIVPINEKPKSHKKAILGNDD